MDIPLLSAALLVSLAGLSVMHSFAAENFFFDRQIIWIAVSLVLFFIASSIDFQPLRRTFIVTTLYIIAASLLGMIFVFGTIVKGAQNRFDLVFFALQPADIAKLALLIILAKYFARRHIEIAHIKHIIISGLYAFVLFGLVALQPDFGSAIVLFSIWFGMVLIAGISWKHLVTFLVIATICAFGMWHFVLKPYQKARIETFIHPLTDIRGTGYNAYQSTIAVGSGQLLGKGIGYGTQSKLQFLPEFQTDFIFASYAEEWGFVGVLLLLALFGIIIVRILQTAMRLDDNFDILFVAGIAVYISAQTLVHVGMDMGLLPITGTTLPFMSYGGSHLAIEYTALGILMSMRRRARPSIQARDSTEIVGAVL
ncbi:MAG: mrdB [Candidatus Kaiserbacteria bacterium]|nr:mrdB [Candidatus Kaiserbacteria bacterium]